MRFQTSSQPAQQLESRLPRLRRPALPIWILKGLLAAILTGILTGQLYAAPAPSEKPTLTNEAPNATLQKTNEPTTLAELDASYTQPAPEFDATPLYLAAFAAIKETNPAAPVFILANQKAIGLLHQAASRPQCRYPIDLKEGFNTKLPHLIKIKLSTQILQQDAHLFAAKGQMDQATRSLLTSLSVCRSLESEPLVISQLVRMRGFEFTVTGLELALNRRSFSEAQMALLFTALQTAEAQDEAANGRALIGERCSGQAAFQSPQQFPGLRGSEETPTSSTSAANPILEQHIRSPQLAEDRAFYLNRLESIIAISKTPFPDKIAAAKAWGTGLAEARTKDYYFSAMLLPALERFVQRSAVAVAELRVAQVALAIERYRWANRQQLPDSLTQLVPQFLPTVPTDPFDGQPLRFKKESARKYSVYSIGPDQQDDNGIHKPAKIYAGLHYDLALTVTR